MTRFSGKVGFGDSVQTPPNSGVWVDVIVERSYRGDVTKAARKLESSDGANPNITVSNSISIVADTYANEHSFNIKYVEWAGARWVVTSVESQRPRLILNLGGVYHGPTP